MRLHSLTATAFGPFAGTVEIDFDALSAAELFLLTGATGAGKSSVLDAVCFGLYGDVPGDRAAAGRLRSDLAAPGEPPRVVLEASLAGRRFRFTRSPRWQRPKKRGTGVTTEQASVVVEELVAGAPVHLTHRLDEAGQLVSELLGMTMAQFTQVALLPQGRFQDFLRAPSSERHQLLQKLFRTRRFEQVERWLRERRTSLRRTSEGHRELVDGLVHRLDEVAGGTEPPPGQPDEHDELVDWAASLACGSAAGVHTARGALEESARVDRTAESALDAGRRLAEHRSRFAAARAELDRLEGRRGAVDALRAEIAAARRAQPVAPLAEVVRRAEAKCAETARGLHTALAALPGDLLPAAGGDDPAVVEPLLQAAAATARDRVAAARALEPVDAERESLASDIDAQADRHRTLDAELTALAARNASLPTELEVARAAQDAAEAAAQRLDVLDREIAGLASRVRARDAATALAAELEQARDRLREAVDRHQGLREEWLAVQELRLSGMAAEIAGALVVGGSCPVCGSCDHPHPARPAPGAPTATVEKQARRAVDDADALRQAHDEQVRALETRLAVVTEQAAGTEHDPATAELDDALAAAGALRTEVGPVAAGRAEANEHLNRLTDEWERLRDRRDALRVDLAGTGSALAAARHRLTEVDRALRAGLDGAPDLAALHRQRVDGLTALTTAVDACRAHREAEARRAEATDDLGREAVARGFADVVAATDALRAPEVLEALDTEVVAHDRAEDLARATLADPVLVAANDRAAPDLTTLEAASAGAREALAAAETAHRSAVERAGRIEALRTQLVDAVAAWTPVADELRVVADLAALVEGTSPDNVARMRLSAYVLAWRLGQVVEAANERLAGMTDGRFALEHTERRGAGETRGGLSLLVRDDWSGESRDPVTLSGGETFVVSLALALGLTDVVTREAGGVELGTLFVDEGFGSLDSETLDDVMDTLDGLRDGGRVVGIVSHVAELRTRIPAQLRVAKHRTGSLVHVEHPFA